MEQTIILMSLMSGKMKEELTEFPIFYSGKRIVICSNIYNAHYRKRGKSNDY